MWIQHFDKSTEIGVPNDRHWPATACDPVNNESSQFLASISGARSERIHHVLLRLDIFPWAAKPLVFNEVAGGVGACVVRYALPASGKNEKEGFCNESKNNDTPFAFEQEVRI